MSLLTLLHDGLFGLLKIERRFDPFLRPAFLVVFRDPLTRLVHGIIRCPSNAEDVLLAPVQFWQGVVACLESIIHYMRAYLNEHYTVGKFERAGYTITHGVVRGDIIVRNALMPMLQ